MVINRIHIIQFGALCNRELGVMPGLNIIEGENESGKTTVAAFLRFIFYGIRPDTSNARYLTAYPDVQKAPVIGGSLDVTLSSPLDAYPDITDYRITRTVIPTDEGTEEHCIICPLKDGTPGERIDTDAAPGALFFGVSGDVFSASAFVGQVTSAAGAKPSAEQAAGSTAQGSYTGGSPIRSAIDRILHAANEELDPDAAIRALQEKRRALYDPETETGSIRDLERRRAALATALETAEAAAAAETKNPAPDTDDRAVTENADSEETHTQLHEALAACDTALAEKEHRAARLAKIMEQYQAYRALDDLDSLKTLNEQKAHAEQRAAALAATMFRGNYIPDEDFTASLHLCADDMRQAEEQTAAAKAELERLDFSVRRDNLKEKQMRRIELDGGADAIRARLDKLYSNRSIVTVFGVFFLLFTVFALATTVFLLILHSDTFQNSILITAILGALAFFFFLSRSRYDKSIGVMLRRYACDTEDELENFIEEYVLSRGKLHSLTENKETLTARMSEQSLHGSEAARQAALLLSKLQPPDAQRITADRLTPDTVSKAADRIDRTLAELNRLYSAADQYSEEIRCYLAEHSAQSEEALIARRQTLAALFERKNAAFRADSLEKELAAANEAVRTLRSQKAALEDALAQPDRTTLPGQDIASVPAPVFCRMSAADIGPDPHLLRTLIAEMDETLRRDRKQYAALNMAIDAVRDASKALHQSIAPRLTENAGKLMALLSDHRYSALVLDDTMHLRAAQNSTESDDAVLPIDLLSAGTQDLAYLSLRMALLHMLYPKELPPMLFDEAFATLDDKRLTRMIALLHRASVSDTETNTAQAIIFTCHKRERRAAEALSPSHILKL